MLMIVKQFLPSLNSLEKIVVLCKELTPLLADSLCIRIVKGPLIRKREQQSRQWRLNWYGSGGSW